MEQVKIDWEHRAYWTGRTARHSTPKQNPYTKGSTLWRRWQEGVESKQMETLK